MYVCMLFHMFFPQPYRKQIFHNAISRDSFTRDAAITLDKEDSFLPSTNKSR